ncbi:hypothetical protein ACFL02_05970 [Planctomycetota bacterium]
MKENILKKIEQPSEKHSAKPARYPHYKGGAYQYGARRNQERKLFF